MCPDRTSDGTGGGWGVARLSGVAVDARVNTHVKGYIRGVIRDVLPRGATYTWCCDGGVVRPEGANAAGSASLLSSKLPGFAVDARTDARVEGNVCDIVCYVLSRWAADTRCRDGGVVLPGGANAAGRASLFGKLSSLTVLTDVLRRPM